MVLSEKFDEALKFANAAHRQQMRKGTAIPYITHLMAVTAMVGENGGDEELMIAAVLHDSMEDQGVTHKEILQRFGRRVADVVLACSDATTKPKPPWRQRKERYLEHLRLAGDDVRLVCVADKLHNAKSISADLHRVGHDVWSRFNASREEILWYYKSIIEILEVERQNLLLDDLKQVVLEIERFGDGD